MGPHRGEKRERRGDILREEGTFCFFLKEREKGTFCFFIDKEREKGTFCFFIDTPSQIS